MKTVTIIAFGFSALAILFCFSGMADAQAAQSCICTSGCQIAADPYPPTALQPATCTVYKAGVAVSTNVPVTLSSGIATSNATRCAPASPTYNPGPAGSVAPLIAIPAQAAGTTVTITMDCLTGPGATPSPTSATFTFTSVSALPQLVAPTNLRVQ